jgi:hypothetical protein
MESARPVPNVLRIYSHSRHTIHANADVNFGHCIILPSRSNLNSTSVNPLLFFDVSIDLPHVPLMYQVIFGKVANKFKWV